MKNYFKRGILLAGISLLLWNCEKDSIPLIENQQKSIKSQEFVSFKELPVSLFNAVNEINPLTNAKYSEYSIPIVVDWDKILKVVDTIDNTKYSVRFRLKSDPKNVFYNLILGVDSNIPINPFILKYTIHNLSEIKKNNYLDLTKFKGTIETYNYQDFMQALSKNSKNKSMKTDLVGPYEPCSTTTFNGTQTGGGTSDSPSDGYSGPDSSVNYGYNDNLDTTTSSGGYSCNWMLVGGALQGDEFYWSLFINCGGEVNTAEKSSETPCPTTSGTIGINLPTLCDNGEPQDIYGNCFPPKTDQIIIDSSFEKYPCQKIIVTDAYGICSPLTQLVLDVFESNNRTNLVFQTSENITGNGNTWHYAIYNPITKENNITIRLRQSYLTTATDLSIARTVIHESVHGLMVQMHEEGKFNLPDGTVDPDFSEIANAYTKALEDQNSDGLGTPQHKYMSKLVEDIATSLSAYGNQNGYSLPFNYYVKLSWAGLTHRIENNIQVENDFFKKAVPNEKDRMTIVNTYVAEQNNVKNLFDGNGNTILPKGKVANASTPCN